ncbi:hypothetical protein ACFLXX_05860, partial [Chloroflexota bacterium]
LLATIREQGEVGREVILESLFFPMRELSRPMSSVPAYNLLANFPLGFLKRVPIPGPDVALGVTAYQIAEMARAATSTTVRGHRLTKKLAKALGNGLNGIWKSREEMKLHGVEVTRQTARGAMHVLDEKPMDVEQVTDSIMQSVVKASGPAGVDPGDAIFGASQGVIQGAAETGTDLGAATLHTIEATKEVAAHTDLSEETAMAKAVEGALLAAEAIGPEAVAEVVESLPDEILALGNNKEGEHDG